MSDSQQYPWILYLISHVEDNVGFLGVFNSNSSYILSCGRNAHVKSSDI